LDEKLILGENEDKIDDVAMRTEAILDAAQASDIRGGEVKSSSSDALSQGSDFIFFRNLQG
jgi:hypothetical protein